MTDWRRSAHDRSVCHHPTLRANDCTGMKMTFSSSDLRLLSDVDARQLQDLFSVKNKMLDKQQTLPKMLCLGPRY